MQDRYKRLGKNTLLVFMGKAGSSVIGLLLLPFYTHWLTTNEYGTTDLINTYASILVGFISCCIADSIFVYPKEADENRKSQYYSSGYIFITITTIISALLLLVFSFVAGKFELKGVFVERIWFILAFAVCQFLQSYSQSFTRSIDKMKVFSLTGVVNTCGIALFSFFLLPHYGLNGYLFAIILANLLTTVFTVFASGSNKYISIKSYNRPALIELLKYGIPLIPNGLMWWLVNGLNRPIMESSLGLDALGLYAVANKFPGLLSMLVTVFSWAWGITMLEEYGKPDFNKFFNRTIKILFFVMTLGACVITACSKLIILFFADDAYYEAWKYVPVLTLSVLLQQFSSTVGGVFMAEKKSKYFFYSSIWGALASLIATIVFIKLWGLQGATIAVAFSFFVMTIARIIYAWKHINEMNVLWYICVFLLYIIFIVVTLLDIPLYWAIPLYISILLMICVLSKDVIVPFISIFGKFNKRL